MFFFTIIVFFHSSTPRKAPSHQPVRNQLLHYLLLGNAITFSFVINTNQQYLCTISINNNSQRYHPRSATFPSPF